MLFAELRVSKLDILFLALKAEMPPKTGSV